MAYDDVPIGRFLDDVASERVAPAGGTAVAVAGAMGAALCEMVCIHTLAARGRDGDGADDGADADRPPRADGETADAEPALEDLRAGLERRRRTLLTLADGDAELVDELFGGGGDGDGGGAGKPSARLRKRAAGVPLAIAEASLAVLEDAAAAISLGREGVAADAKTGAYLADAAVRASLATVRINVETLPDRSFADDVADRAASIERSAAAVRREVFDDPGSDGSGGSESDETDSAETDSDQASGGGTRSR